MKLAITYGLKKFLYNCGLRNFVWKDKIPTDPDEIIYEVDVVCFSSLMTNINRFGGVSNTD